MRNVRVRLQTAPHGLLRVVPPGHEVVYLAIRDGDRLHPIWTEDGLSLFIDARSGADGELVIDLLIIAEPPDDPPAAVSVAA